MRNFKMDSMILLTINALILIHLYFYLRHLQMLFKKSILYISKLFIIIIIIP